MVIKVLTGPSCPFPSGEGLADPTPDHGRGRSRNVVSSASGPVTVPTILAPYRSYLAWYAASIAACASGAASAKVTSFSTPPARMRPVPLVVARTNQGLAEP